MAATAATSKCTGAAPGLQRWCKEQSGATAIEFGMVALPFVLLLFGILSV